MLASTTWQKVLASVAAIALMVGLSGVRPSSAAQPVSLIGVVDNTDAIASCSLSIDAATKMATPLVTLQPPAHTTATDVRFTFYNSAGVLVETHDVSVPPPSFGPTLEPFTFATTFAKTHCNLKPADATPTAATASASSGGGGGGALIIGGVLAVGAIAAVAAGHGGGGSSSSSPTSQPFVTPTPFSPTPTPSPTAKPTASPTTKPTASPTAKPSASPTAKPTASPTASPSPTPSPTATPTATPTPTPAPLTITPNSLTFTSTSSTQTATAMEMNYTGAYAAANGSCTPSIATISASNGGAFTVTPMGSGSCAFVISDTHQQTVMLSVTVTITNGTIETRHRTPKARS